MAAHKKPAPPAPPSPPRYLSTHAVEDVRRWSVIGFGGMPECRSGTLREALSVFYCNTPTHEVLLREADIPVWDGNAGAMTTLGAWEAAHPLPVAPEAPRVLVTLPFYWAPSHARSAAPWQLALAEALCRALAAFGPEGAPGAAPRDAYTRAFHAGPCLVPCWVYRDGRVEAAAPGTGVVCGAAACATPAAWVDSCGVGWCLLHCDAGLEVPPLELLQRRATGGEA